MCCLLSFPRFAQNADRPKQKSLWFMTSHLECLNQETRLAGKRVEQGYGLVPSIDLFSLIKSCHGEKTPLVPCSLTSSTLTQHPGSASALMTMTISDRDVSPWSNSWHVYDLPLCSQVPSALHISLHDIACLIVERIWDGHWAPKIPKKFSTFIGTSPCAILQFDHPVPSFQIAIWIVQELFEGNMCSEHVRPSKYHAEKHLVSVVFFPALRKQHHMGQGPRPNRTPWWRGARLGYTTPMGVCNISPKKLPFLHGENEDNRASPKALDFLWPQVV